MNQFPGGFNPYAARPVGASMPQAQPQGQMAFPAVNQLGMLAAQQGVAQGGMPANYDPRRAALAARMAVASQAAPSNMAGLRPGVAPMAAGGAALGQMGQFAPVAAPAATANMASLRPGVAPTPTAGAQGQMGQFAPAQGIAPGRMPANYDPRRAAIAARMAAGGNPYAAAGAPAAQPQAQAAMALSDRRAKRVLSLREILGR